MGLGKQVLHARCELRVGGELYRRNLIGMYKNVMIIMLFLEFVSE